MRISRPKSFGLLLLLAAPLLCGCGLGRPKPYPVSGKVIFPDGSPLKGGTVVFQSAGTGAAVFTARGLVSEDGTFQMTTFKPNDGAVPGEHRVLVREAMAVDEFQPASAMARAVDPRFMRFDTSGLTVNVKKERNDVTIQVEHPAPRRK